MKGVARVCSAVKDRAGLGDDKGPFPLCQGTQRSVAKSHKRLSASLARHGFLWALFHTVPALLEGKVTGGNEVKKFPGEIATK